jgi:flagellar biosynthesis/type III secretory pathway protein FliH
MTTNDSDTYVEALIEEARADAFNAGHEKGVEEAQDSIKEARQEAFDDGYLRGVTVSREIIEKRVMPQIGSLEAVAVTLRHALKSHEVAVIALRDALGIPSEPTGANRRNAHR